MMIATWPIETRRGGPLFPTWRVLSLVVAVLAAVSCGSPGKQSPAESSPPAPGDRTGTPNVIIIVNDALRADHLSCYGYARHTSPFIDTLGAEGALFERATSGSTITRESVSAIFTGQYPSSSGSTGAVASPDPARPHLARYFRDAGYVTAFISDSYGLALIPFTDGLGFDKIVHAKPQDPGGRGRAPELTQHLLGFVKACDGRKFMVYVHYLDPHAPYEPPDNYYLRFAEAIFPNPVPLYGPEGLRDNCARFVADGFGPDDPRFKDLVLRYDAEIALVDDAIRALCEGLKNLGVLDNTIIVFTSDHGEEFLEHGFLGHGWTVYEESNHVPLIFWAPGRVASERVTTRVSHVDLLPTVLTLADIEYAAGDMDGLTLLARAQGIFRPAVRKRPILCELLVEKRNLLRSVLKDEWKYIAAMKWRPAETRREDILLEATISRELWLDGRESMDIWSPVIHEELYNLAADPGETQNLLGRTPQTEALRCELATYRAYCAEHGLQHTPAVRRRKLTPEDLDALSALGYVGEPSKRSGPSTKP